MEWWYEETDADKEERQKRREWFEAQVNGEVGDFVREYFLCEDARYDELGEDLERHHFYCIEGDSDRVTICDSYAEAYDRAGRYSYAGIEWKYYKRLGEQAWNIFCEEKLDLFKKEPLSGMVLGG